MKTQSSQAQAAKAIRAELKTELPGVKFRVLARSASMMTAVDINWTDGPTRQQVAAITDKYEYGTFDGMTDSYNYDNNRDDIPQAKYVQCHRDHAEGLFETIRRDLISALAGHDPDEDLPYQLWQKTDLCSGYKGVRRTGVTCGHSMDFYEIVTGDSPTETPDRCDRCSSVLEADAEVFDGVCQACIDRDAEEARITKEYEEHNAKRAVEAKLIEPEIVENDCDVFTTADFAHLNKNDTIEEYRKECEHSSDYTTENVKITHVATLTARGYDAFCHQFMTDFDWLAGLGGTDSHYDTKYETFQELCRDEEEMEKWRAESYRLGVLVTDGRRAVIADPQGYNYARYVGINPDMRPMTDFDLLAGLGRTDSPNDEPLKLHSPIEDFDHSDIDAMAWI